MALIDLAVFYDPRNWTRLFWEYNKAYTIVPGRHIGTDITTYGQAKPIPALLSGPIVDWVDTTNIGRVYIQDVSESGSEFKYLSYCHASRYDAPRLGQHLYQGDLFGKIATGPKSVGYGHPNYPGSSWSGAHLHLVWHNKPRGAYMLGQNDRYGNPEDLIRNVLSTPAGTPTTPFDPEEEMTENDFNRIQAMITDAVIKVQKSSQSQMENRLPRIQQMITEAVIKIQESTQTQLNNRIAVFAKAVWKFRLPTRKADGSLAVDAKGNSITSPAEDLLASTYANTQK